MADDGDYSPPNVVLVTIAALVTFAAIANAVSAALTDSVWNLTGSGAFSRGFGTTLVRVERADDPLSFYVILVATAAFAVYLDRDLWKRFRAWRRRRG